MNDDTFSGNEERMVQFYRSNGSYKPRETASGFANVVGARLANDAMSESRHSMIAQLRDAHDVEDVASAVRKSSLPLGDIVAILAFAQRENERDIAALRAELADLRAAQSAPPTGAHPYRSGPHRPAVPASNPVDASAAPERVEGRPGALRRVYGALAGWGWPAALGATCAVTWWGAATHDTTLGVGGLAASALVAMICAMQPREIIR